jgi:predicted MPP superfamily phosphohydrolase
MAASMRNAARSLRGLNDWRLWAAGVVTAVGIAFVEAQGIWSAPGRQALTTGGLALYWGLWLLWPLALLYLLGVISHLVRGRIVRALLSALLLAATVVLLWARFVEPAEIEVRESSVGTACGVRVALVSDLHAGIFVRPGDLDRLVTRLNALDVDAVLVAGDWTYGPKRDLRAQFAPLASLRHRAYGVLGNHDEERPGPPLQQPLRSALQGYNVQFIEGRRVMLGRCELAGLGDRSAGSAQRDLAELAKSRPQRPAAQRVALAHDPDTAAAFEPGFAAVTLAGHTHGGQIDLPWITDRLLAKATRGGYKRGAYSLPATQLFVTSGVGTSHLPLRLGMPPTIDVLAL